MNDVIYNVSLDMYETQSQCMLAVKKSDNGRRINFVLTEGGRPYVISEGCSAVLRAKKPGGTVLFNNCVIDGNVISYTLTNQTSAAAGIVDCELMLSGSDGKQITSPRFSLRVEDTLYSEDEIESTDEFTELQKAIAKAESLVVDVSNKVDKVAGKGLSTNDYTDEEKIEVSKIVNKADIYDVERVTSNNHFNASAAITGKVLNVGGTILDYAAGVLSDKIPVKGKYVVCSMSEAMTGTTAYRIAGYKTVDGVETFVTGTYKFSEPKIAYTTKSGQTRYRTASGIDYSSCEYIRISTTTTDVAKSYMVGFTDKNLSAYNEDYDEYSKTLDKYLNDDIKVKKTEAAFVAIENNNAKHLSIHKAMSQFVLSDKTLKIKLLGDSITEGYGGTGFVKSSEIGVETNTSGVCWANMLREYMTEKFGCTFVNLGSSGMNSQTMYNNIFVSPKLIDGSEDVVLLMIGTNDRKKNTKATFYSNLKAIIEKIQANGTKVVIMSSIPSSAKEEAITTNAYHMDDVDDIIMKVATDLNIEYISLYKLFDKHLRYSGAKLTDYLNSDGLHPNDEGYKVMYKLILSALGFADDGAVTLPQFPVSLNDKVDKVDGKGLSTNDFTNEDKAEVAKVSNKLDKPSSNGGVLYINSFDQPSIKGIASSAATSDTSEIATVKIVKDYINSLDASEVSY